MLATRTTTPGDCYFCVWDGFGPAEFDSDDGAVYIDEEEEGAQRADAQPGLAPQSAVSSSIPPVPKVVVPNRAYWLFRGPLVDVGSWDTAEGLPYAIRLDTAEPAFVWPADHAWCFALDVDSHWAGIGAHPPLITKLTSDPRLDVVPADPTQGQPSYGLGVVGQDLGAVGVQPLGREGMRHPNSCSSRDAWCSRTSRRRSCRLGCSA